MGEIVSCYLYGITIFVLASIAITGIVVLLLKIRKGDK